MKRKLNLFAAVFFTALCVSLFLGMLTFSAGAVSAPENVKAGNTASGISLSWKSVPGADSYEVYAVESGKTRLLNKTKATSFTDTSVADGVSRRYKIRAVVGKSAGPFVYVTYRRLAPPKITGVTQKNGAVTVKWNRCPNATGYVLYKKTSKNGSFVKIASLKKEAVSYTDTSTVSGTVTYALSQVNGQCVSALSQTASTAGKASTPAAPKNLRVKNSPKGVTLRWSKTTGGAKTEIMRKAAGEWKRVATVSASVTSYTDKGVLYSRKNTYVIRSISSSGKRSANSNAASLYAVNPNKKMVALTYDDGPYRPVTNAILDTLKSNGARATFFVVGSRLSTYSDCLKREAEQGCQIGCHTYNHTTLTKASDSTIRSEIAKTNELIKKYTGKTAEIVRAPGGSVNARVKSVVAYPLVNWSVDTRDWSNRSSSVTYENFKKGVRDGSIVLMHDLYPSTAQATKSIVAYLKRNGYQIVTVSEMMDAKGITMTKGKLYTSA